MAVNTKMPLTNTADGYLCEGTDIRGGYFVIDKLVNIPSTITKVGSLCFCQEDSKFYQFNGTSWESSLVIPSIDGLASEDFVTESIKNKVDDTTLENYYTKTEADEEFMTQSEVDTRINDVISKASNTDTIKDLTSLVDYLDSHGTEASEMATAITELETNKADNAEATQEVAGLMSAADKKKLDSIAEGADVNVADTDETITLVTDLYAYTTIGKISASNTNPKLVATAGSTLKTVFNTVFGTQQDEQPTIDVSGVSLSKSQGTTSFGGGEYGESISATTDTITFTLNNSATASYGYRCGNVKTVGSARFKYAITKQSNADIKITLPSGQTASSSMVTAGTYISHSGNVLYCNFNSSNQVKIKISLAAGNTTTSSQTRYETITGSVVLGEAWTNDGTTAKKIDKFLTYLKNDATTTSYYSGGNKDATTSRYTISAGYVPYGYTLTASLPSSLPTSGRSKSKPSSITVSGGNSSTYLYIFVPTDNSDITSLTASGFDVPFSKISSSTSLVVNNNKSATYKVFKTNDPVKADTFKL